MKSSVDRARRGITLMEVAVATLIVGVVLVGALRNFAAATRSGQRTSERVQATFLAQSLMAEILSAKYERAAEDGPPPSDTTDRLAFVAVSDYDGWSASPPEDRTGQVLPGLSGWQRRVVVTLVDPNDLTRVISEDRGIKRIEVTVSQQEIPVTTAVAYQTRAWIDMIPQPDGGQATGSPPPGNRPPVAVAAGEPLVGQESVTVQFDGEQSFDPDRDPLQYHWDFGDGNDAVGSRPSHTFFGDPTQDTVFTVTLTVTDPDGAVAEDQLPVTVLANGS